MGKSKGSLTVEAALTLPIFLFVILSISFLIKAVYVYEIMEHAIMETAKELSTYSYILTVSGVKEIDDIIDDGTKRRGELFNRHLDTFVEGFVAIEEFSGTIQDNAEAIGEGELDIDYEDIKKKYDNLEEKLETALESGEEIFENPQEEALSILFSFGGLVYNDAKKGVLQNISKLILRKYISPGDPSQADQRLKSLNIEGGLSGLDFKYSKLFENGDDIDLIVSYKLDLVLPIQFLPDLNIIHRATVRGWLNGEQ